jgi:hypothetical protein
MTVSESLTYMFLVVWCWSFMSPIMKLKLFVLKGIVAGVIAQKST